MKRAWQEEFERFAAWAAWASGTMWAYMAALTVVGVWALTGPVFGFSPTWQLVINTGTTVITFLMVFIIQHSQNKETRTIQLKLNELIAAQPGASNRLIDLEALTDHEILYLQKRFHHLAQSAARLAPGAATSIEEEVGEAKDGMR